LAHPLWYYIGELYPLVAFHLVLEKVVMLIEPISPRQGRSAPKVSVSGDLVVLALQASPVRFLVVDKQKERVTMKKRLLILVIVL